VPQYSNLLHNVFSCCDDKCLLCFCLAGLAQGTGKRHETVNFGDHEVKVQGHTRPKVDLEA